MRHKLSADPIIQVTYRTAMTIPVLMSLVWPDTEPTKLSADPISQVLSGTAMTIPVLMPLV